MAAAQVRHFEHLLAGDQAAREALASVIRIEAALLAVRERPLSSSVARKSRGSVSSHRRLPFVLGLAATTVACAWILLVQSGGIPQATRMAGGESALLKTAAVWTSLARPGESLPLDDVDPMFHLNPVEVPDWMFAAVNIDDGSSTGDRTDDEEDLL
jgi:hypothetical protein